jgi:hypothetical protein
MECETRCHGVPWWLAPYVERRLASGPAELGEAAGQQLHLEVPTAFLPVHARVGSRAAKVVGAVVNLPVRALSVRELIVAERAHTHAHTSRESSDKLTR